MAMRHLFRRQLALVPVALLASMLPAPAQQYPTRPIHVLVPFTPGGTPEIVARIVGAAIEKSLGQPVIVESRPGANGIIGTKDVAVADPDGYTLLQTPPAFVINPYVHKTLPYDIFRDFAPIANAGISRGYFLLVRPTLPVHTVAELIDYAKTHRVLYGSPGIGNTLHLAAALFGAEAGIPMENVVFRDNGPMITALLAGTIDLVFQSPASASGLLGAGMRAIGFTGTAPSPDLPNVPLVNDAVPGLEIAGSWEGWLAPAKTPQSIIDRLNAEVRAAVKVPSVRAGIEQAGYDPSDMSPAEFGAFLHIEAERYAKAVTAAKIVPE